MYSDRFYWTPLESLRHILSYDTTFYEVRFFERLLLFLESRYGNWEQLPSEDKRYPKDLNQWRYEELDG